MKKVLFALVVSLSIASCSNDTKNESSSPANDARDKFIAYWLANENSALAGPTAYTVNIIKSTTNANEILIYTFYGIPNSSVRASISNNQLVIPYQIFGGNNFTQGNGLLTTANTISLNYTTTVGASRDSCSAIYTKQ